jgi:hypothetical protein
VATIALCYAGADKTAENVLKPVRQFGRPLINLVRARPYPDWQKALDPAWENGAHNQWMGHYYPNLLVQRHKKWSNMFLKLPHRSNRDSTLKTSFE